MLKTLRKISSMAIKEQEKKKRLKEKMEINEEEIRIQERHQEQLILKRQIERKINRIVKRFEKRAKKSALNGQSELRVWHFYRTHGYHGECDKRPLQCECVFQKTMIKELKNNFEPKGFKVNVNLIGEEKLPFHIGYDECGVYVSWK